MKKSSNKNWLKEHFSDSYVKRAKQEGFRARSVYKLMEIDKRYKLIKPNMIVVDLGASPGGWSEYIAKLIGSKGKLIALDLCDFVIVGGSDSLCELTLSGFASLEAIANELTNPFSVNRKGINIGEGAALRSGGPGCAGRTRVEGPRRAGPIGCAARRQLR